MCCRSSVDAVGLFERTSHGGRRVRPSIPRAVHAARVCEDVYGRVYLVQQPANRPVERYTCVRVGFLFDSVSPVLACTHETYSVPLMALRLDRPCVDGVGKYC